MTVPEKGEGASSYRGHEYLIAEMKETSKLPVEERIVLAKENRQIQLDGYKEWGTESNNTRAKGPSIKFPEDVCLMDAAAKGSVEDMKLLLKKGMDPNTQNFDGLTALHQSCIDGTEEMVRILLKYGARVDAVDRDGWTPLHAAATCGHLKIVDVLLKEGADLLAVNGDGDLPFDITEDQETLEAIERAMSEAGITNEMIEERRQDLSNQLLRDAKFILEEGMDINAPVNEDGATLLHIAIVNSANSVVKMLLENGASDTTVDVDGWRPVHAAAYWGNRKAIELLVRTHNTDLKALNGSSQTPYELADNEDFKTWYLDQIRNHPNSSKEEERKSSVSSVSSASSEETKEENIGDTKEEEKKTASELEDTTTATVAGLEKVESFITRQNSIRRAKEHAPGVKISLAIAEDQQEYDNSYDMMLMGKKKNKKPVIEEEKEFIPDFEPTKRKIVQFPAMELGEPMETEPRDSTENKWETFPEYLPLVKANSESLSDTKGTTEKQDTSSVSSNSSLEEENKNSVGRSDHNNKTEEDDREIINKKLPEVSTVVQEIAAEHQENIYEYSEGQNDTLTEDANQKKDAPLAKPRTIVTAKRISSESSSDDEKATTEVPVPKSRVILQPMEEFSKETNEKKELPILGKETTSPSKFFIHGDKEASNESSDEEEATYATVKKKTGADLFMRQPREEITYIDAKKPAVKKPAEKKSEEKRPEEKKTTVKDPEPSGMVIEGMVREKPKKAKGNYVPPPAEVENIYEEVLDVVKDKEKDLKKQNDFNASPTISQNEPTENKFVSLRRNYVPLPDKEKTPQKSDAKRGTLLELKLKRQNSRPFSFVEPLPSPTAADLQSNQFRAPDSPTMIRYKFVQLDVLGSDDFGDYDKKKSIFKKKNKCSIM